jgi:hypothetical protein
MCTYIIKTMYDYLVVGAGLNGMCFVDVILRYTDKTIMLVDKKVGPGGHWVDPYPHVHLHQKAEYYGIESLKLTDGSGLSVKKHFEKALEIFSQNKNFSCSFNVSIDFENIDIPHKCFVDATYLTVHRLPPKWNMSTPWTIRHRASLVRHVVIGGGKTGMDTCVWLRKQGIPVTWVVSHDAVWLKREMIDDLGPVPSLFWARITDFIVKRLNPWFALRQDNRVFSLSSTPTRHRCAIVTTEEYNIIQGVDIVRHGYVKERKGSTLVFEDGEKIDFADSEFVDCIQNGIPVRNTVPIFQKNKIVLQPIAMCQQSFSAVTIAKLEARNIKLDLKPLQHPKTLADGVHGYSTSMVNLAVLKKYANWVFDTRLNQYI